MIDPHQLIAQHGLAGARRRAATKLERLCVDAAADMEARAGETREPIFGGPSITSLPHRRLSPEDERAPWVRELHCTRYRIAGGPSGVPFGSKARLSLLWMHEQAIRKNRRVLGPAPSMHAWAKRLGMESGGMTYRIAREQFERLAGCRISVAYNADPLPEHSFPILDGAAQSENATSDLSGPVVLSEEFFQHVISEPVALDPVALAHVSNNCWALDLYVTFAARLPGLKEPSFMSWREFFGYFGGHNKYSHHMKASFLDAVALVKAIYKDARVAINANGITYYPSAAPFPYARSPERELAQH